MKMTWTGMSVRVAAAILFCAVTFNSTGYHLFALAEALWHDHSIWPVLFGGAIWSAVAAFLVWTTLSSLGRIGVAFVVAILATAVGWAIHAGLLDERSTIFWQNALPLAVGVILGIGMIAGFLMRWTTGRTQTEDPDT